MKKRLPLLHPILFAILPIVKISTSSSPILLIAGRAALLLGLTLVLIWALKPLLPSMPQRTVFISFFLLLFFNWLLVYYLLVQGPVLGSQPTNEPSLHCLPYCSRRLAKAGQG